MKKLRESGNGRGKRGAGGGGEGGKIIKSWLGQKGINKGLKRKLGSKTAWKFVEIRSASSQWVFECDFHFETATNRELFNPFFFFICLRFVNCGSGPVEANQLNSNFLFVKRTFDERQIFFKMISTSEFGKAISSTKNSTEGERRRFLESSMLGKIFI